MPRQLPCKLRPRISPIEIQYQNGPKSAQIYTDDSKLERAVGIGIYSKLIGIFKSMRLPDHCSVFQAEIRAEVKIIVDKNVHKRRITILSDSQAAIKALDSSVIKFKTMYDCAKYLNEMANRYEVCITWALGHRDIPGNCRANDLARRDMTIELSDEFSILGIPLSICRLIIDSFGQGQNGTKNLAEVG